MPREQVDPGQITERLQPQAAPVNTFVEAPSDPGAGKNLMELAQALRGFGGDLDGLLSKQDAEQKQADYLAGQEAFYTKNKDGLAQGIAQGSIPAQASPNFTRGLSEAQGDAAGSDLSMRFQTAYDQWDGKNYAGADAPQKFAEWRNGWVQDQVKAAGNADPFFFKGLKPHLEAVTSASNNVFTKDQHDLVYNGAISTAGTQIMQRADDLYSRGLGSGTGTDYGQVFAQTQALRAGLISNGVREDDATKMANDAMVAAATKYKEPGFLGWFNQENPQKKATYGQDPAGVVQADQARKTVDTLQRQDLSDQHSIFTQKQQADKADIDTKAINWLMDKNNVGQPVPAEIVQRAAANGDMGDFPIKLMQWQKEINQGVGTDADTLSAVTMDMMGNPQSARATLMDAVHNHKIRSADDLTKLNGLAENLTQHADGISQMLGSREVERVDSAILSNTAGMDISDPLRPHPNAANADTFRAQAAFHEELTSWAVANPNAGVVERMKAVNELGARYLGAIAPNPSGPGVYSPPSGAPANPYDKIVSDQKAAKETSAPQPAQPAAPVDDRPFWKFWGAPNKASQTPAAPPAVAPLAAPPVPAGQGQPPLDVPRYRQWVTALNPDEQKAVQAEVDRTKGNFGGNANLARQNIFRTVQSRQQLQVPAPAAPAGPPSAPISPSTPGQVLDKALQHPAAQGILQKGAALLPAAASAMNPISSAQAREAPAPGVPASTPGVHILQGAEEPQAPASAPIVNTSQAASQINWDKGGDQNNEKRSILVTHAVALGLPPQAAAAIIGHADAESNFRTKAFNPTGEDSHGLFQWNEKAGRWAPFVQWAQSNGRSAEDPLAQLDYAKVEASKMKGPGGQNLWDAVKSAPDLQTASRIWMDYFEQPKVRDYGNRISKGQAALAAFEGNPMKEDPGQQSYPRGPASAAERGAALGGVMPTPQPAPRSTNAGIIELPSTTGGSGGADLSPDAERVLDRVSADNPGMRFVIGQQRNEDGSVRPKVIAVDKRGRTLPDGPEQQALLGTIAATAKALGVKLNETSGLNLFVEPGTKRGRQNRT